VDPDVLWTATPGAKETRAMVYMNWYEAYAFCTWDGGFMPTDTEWRYAAAGGNEQRNYPWGNASPDCSYANGGTPPAPQTSRILCAPEGTNVVGSESPKGDGKWRQADLAGNAQEWSLDLGLRPNPCVDCVQDKPTGEADYYCDGDGYGSFRAMSTCCTFHANPQGYRWPDLGARCARAP
jgi:formylglycine-generating enzyme required for sulfatase activity